MKFAYVIATSMVATVAADEFYWKPNNNFGTVSNWDVDGAACDGSDGASQDCPTLDSNDVVSFAGAMVIPDADECNKDNNWNAEEGRILKMDRSVNIGALILPSDGKIMLGDDIVMTFDEDLAEGVDSLPETNWKCKDIAETNWKCGANWATTGFNGDASHRVPCASDTVIFPDDISAFQINVPANTFVSSLRLENPNDFDVQSAFVANDGNYNMRSQSEVDRYFSVYENQFQGGVASVGDECGNEEKCQEFCHNHCHTLDEGNEEAQRVGLMESMSAAKERADTYADGVADGKVPDDRCKVRTKLSGDIATDSITDFGAKESAFTAKYATLFQNETTGQVLGNDADAVTSVFSADLTTHFSNFGNLFDFFPTQQPPCVVTAVGGVDCSAVADIQTTICSSRDVTAQLFYILDAYFCQSDCSDTNGVIVLAGEAVLTQVATGTYFPSNFASQDRDIAIVFGFSDAEFFRSRYAKAVFPRDGDGEATGFLSRSDSETVAKSLDMGHAVELLNEYASLSGDQQSAFKAKVIAEVELTSVLDLESGSSFVLEGEPVAKDPTKSHKFDQARFSIELTNENMPEIYDMESLQTAFAVAFWAVVSTDLAPQYALNELHKFTSTTATTTTTTTTSATTTTEFFDVETDFSEADKRIIESESRESLVLALDAASVKVVAAQEALSLDPENPTLIAALQAARDEKTTASRNLEYYFFWLENGGPEESGTGGAGGGPPIAIIAGGAGGVVVILLIVIVVMASKGGGNGGSAAPNGTSVVAFENPMYEDPQTADRENPMYDGEQAGGDGGDEGLYDEPAFNDEGGAGGYLDVEPDEESSASEGEEASESEEAFGSEESESDDE